MPGYLAPPDRPISRVPATAAAKTKRRSAAPKANGRTVQPYRSRTLRLMLCSLATMTAISVGPDIALGADLDLGSNILSLSTFGSSSLCRQYPFVTVQYPEGIFHPCYCTPFCLCMPA